MNTQLLTVVALLQMIFLGLTWTTVSSAASADQQEFLRRYLLHKYHAFKQREVTEDQKQIREFQQEALESHNILRAQHCSPPLVLDEEINVRAQIYANILASNDSKLIHSTDRLGRFGENLYAITRSSPIKNVGGACEH